MSKLHALYVLDPAFWNKIYAQDVQEAIAQRVEVLAPALSAEAALSHPELLASTNVLFSGWGGPVLNEKLLDLMPNLQVVLYGAGSIRHIATDAFWERHIPIAIANEANAIPVAEYTLAHIILGLRSFWASTSLTRRLGTFPPYEIPVAGAYQSQVGLVSLSSVGKLVRQHLEHFDVSVMAYDPCISPQEGALLNVELADLPRLFATSDVVSIHAPLLKETTGLITGELIASMKPGATLINTARGPIIREGEMVEVLRQRPDLTAVLDVTDPQPPLPGGITTLQNVIVSPHIAGSLGRECARMGHRMVAELDRFLAGKSLHNAVTLERLATMA